MSTIAYAWVVLTVAAAAVLVLVIAGQAAYAQAQRALARAVQRRRPPSRVMAVSRG